MRGTALAGMGIVALAVGMLAAPSAEGAWTQQAKLTASDAAAEDWFGRFVAIDGDTAVVSSLLGDGGAMDSGAAYVYQRAGRAWYEVAKLTPSDAEAEHRFGASVAVQGGCVVVGAPGTGDGVGAAYVYTRPAGGWTDVTETARLTASDSASGSLLGTSAAIQNDTIVVGARGQDGGRGALYLYSMPGGGWTSTTQTAKLTAGDGAAEDRLGFSVDLCGDTVIGGLDARDCCGGNDTRKAYVFARPAGGWADATETARLTTSDGGSWEIFGHDVATNGQTILIGCPRDNDVGSWSGSVYVYDRPVGGWSSATETTELHASGAQDWEEFGIQLAVDGQRALVTSTWGVVGGQAVGTAHILERSGAAWIEVDRFTGDDSVNGDVFGYAADLSGDTAIIGAYLDDHSGLIDAGSAYIFTPEPSVALLVGIAVPWLTRRRRATGGAGATAAEHAFS